MSSLTRVSTSINYRELHPFTMNSSTRLIDLTFKVSSNRGFIWETRHLGTEFLFAAFLPPGPLNARTFHDSRPWGQLTILPDNFKMVDTRSSVPRPTSRILSSRDLIVTYFSRFQNLAPDGADYRSYGDESDPRVSRVSIPNSIRSTLKGRS